MAASKFANAVADQLIAYQPRPAESGYKVSQLSPAQPPTSPSNPRTPILLGAAAFGVIARDLRRHVGGRGSGAGSAGSPR